MTVTTTIHTEMRRHDRAVDDPTIIKAFLHRCKMIVLSIHDEPCSPFTMNPSRTSCL